MVAESSDARADGIDVDDRVDCGAAQATAAPMITPAIRAYRIVVPS